MSATKERLRTKTPNHELPSAANVAAMGRSVESRVAAYSWNDVGRQLDANGWALLGGILRAEECEALAGLYEDDGNFRKHIVMARHGFGQGEYKYFAYPLPDIITELRTSIYPHLAPIADRWNEAMGIDVRYPAEHARFLERCHAAGQSRPVGTSSHDRGHLPRRGVRAAARCWVRRDEPGSARTTACIAGLLVSTPGNVGGDDRRESAGVSSEIAV